MVSHLRLKEMGAALDGARSPGVARVTLAGLTGSLATVTALAVGSVLALMFAATLAVVLVLAVCLAAVAATAWRFQRRALRRGPLGAGGPVIEAHKVGHSWVAYGWDRQA